jgi:uncharacterized membrane protein YbhN (UPF0104 family)
MHIAHPLWILVAIVIYSISHVTTSLAWPFALRALGEPIALTEGLKIGLIAQIGKYLPGNVAHYFGRAALAKTSGIAVKASGLSTAIELACAIIAALIVAPGVLVHQRSPLVLSAHVNPIAAMVSTVIALVILAVAIWKFKRAYRHYLFVIPAVCITMSLLLSGLAAYALFAGLGVTAIPWTLVVGAFGVAWIVGFLTPGSPGGLGVRETMFVILLGPTVGSVPALACAILHRIITAGVDAVASIVGYVWFASATRSKM